MEIKITKREKLLSVRNEWVSNDYWLIHGRIYNDEKNAFYRFKFVLHIDPSFDLWDIETETDRDYKEAMEEMIFSFCDFIAADFFSNELARRRFVNMCNDTIMGWNASVR